MIRGKVNAEHEAIISLNVHGPNRRSRKISCIIALGMGRVILADGSEKLCQIYEAVVQWHGKSQTIEVDAAETEPLLGMVLLSGSELNIVIRRGGDVSIRLLP